MYAQAFIEGLREKVMGNEIDKLLSKLNYVFRDWNPIWQRRRLLLRHDTYEMAHTEVAWPYLMLSDTHCKSRHSCWCAVMLVFLLLSLSWLWSMRVIIQGHTPTEALAIGPPEDRCQNETWRRVMNGWPPAHICSLAQRLYTHRSYNRAASQHECSLERTPKGPS